MKSSGVSKITPVRSKNWTITVSAFLSNLQQTALLLKKFRLRLHCYTLRVRIALHLQPKNKDIARNVRISREVVHSQMYVTVTAIDVIDSDDLNSLVATPLN